MWTCSLVVTNCSVSWSCSHKILIFWNFPFKVSSLFFSFSSQFTYADSAFTGFTAPNVSRKAQYLMRISTDWIFDIVRVSSSNLTCAYKLSFGGKKWVRATSPQRGECPHSVLLWIAACPAVEVIFGLSCLYAYSCGNHKYPSIHN